MTRFLAVGALLGFAAFAIAGQSSGMPELLQKALSSATKHKLTGTRIVEFRRGSETMHHEEHIIRDRGRVRIEFPSGSKFAGQIIVETPSERRHFFPDRNEIRVLPPRQDDTIARLRRLVKGRNGMSYSFANGQKVPIAGIQTQQVLVKDPYGNIIQKLYIEPKHGVILRRVLFDRGGAPVGSFHYTKINLNPTINPAVFTLSRKGARIVTPIDDLREAVRSGEFDLRTISGDTGFQIEFVRVMKPRGEPVLMQVLSKGDQKISLFQLGTSVSPERLKKMGKGRSATYSWQEDGRWYVLVGPLSQTELQRLSKSLTDQP